MLSIIFRMRVFISFVFVSVLCSCWGEDLDAACVSLERTHNQVVRPKVILVEETGHLYSPGFEKNLNYPSDVQCSYQLQVPPGKHIRLHFNTIDIDATDGCGSDSLSIHDFDPKGHGVLQFVLCGRHLPYDFVSESHALQLVLKTDGFAERRGFNITYSVQENGSVCPDEQIQCRNRNCVENAKVCNGIDDCGDGTDEESCSRLIPDPPDCGKPEIEPLSSPDRIVGGQAALYGSFPWMADLQMRLIEPNGHTCGGVLINAQWVLSAAHCFQDTILRKPSGWRIHLGNYRKFERDDHEQIRYAERIVIYDDIPPEIFEKNGEFDMMHDVALVKLNAPVNFTKYVRPICLPDPDLKLDIMGHCYAAGWGATRGTGSSDVLKQAYHPVQANVMCSRLVGSQFNPYTMICAGSLAPLLGVCHGDSGGPLMCKIGNSWKVVGVASYVTDGTGDGGLCGLRSRPSVFNKVVVKLDWIRRTIDKYN